MKDNKIILKISIILIGISLLITIVGINIIKIDKPVFLKIYIEESVNKNEDGYYLDDSFLELKYISNIDDTRLVTGITFKELPKVYFYATEYSKFNIGFYGDNNISSERYGRYEVHTVNVSCPNIAEKEVWEEIILSEAIVSFSDGLELEVNLGEIILYEEKERPIALEGISSQGSSDGMSSSTFRIIENAKIESIESPLYDNALEIFDFNITTQRYNETIATEYKEGSIIEKNSIIEFSAKYTWPKDIIKQYTLYDIKPSIQFVNEYNDRYKLRYYNMRNNVHFSYYGIFKYLRAIGEL